ncbi:MAG: putative Fe-S cluster assembly protein SufT [Verrucomicrobiaceae bacterium]|nr:putative Fe-S cluster assembly protein SufT [Verrucomicrobiaceae bacterium]
MSENNQQGSELELARDIEAIQIPSGDTFTLPAGTKVIITQSLGGTYTVATDQGLARISEKDSDALGIHKDKESQPATEKVNSGGNVDSEAYQAAVWEQLKTVFDPEIPVNIVDLGLVYDCTVIDTDGNKSASVKMTLTAPGCGMGPTIAADAQSKIMTINGIEDAKVELVWDPPWNQDMISEEGKMKLGMV